MNLYQISKTRLKHCYGEFWLRKRQEKWGLSINPKYIYKISYEGTETIRTELNLTDC